MAGSPEDLKAFREDWRELIAREGEWLEAYGQALQAYGRGEIPPEVLACNLIDVTARRSVGAAKLSLQLNAAYYRWVLSLVGVHLEPGAQTQAHNVTRQAAEAGARFPDQERN